MSNFSSARFGKAIQDVLLPLEKGDRILNRLWPLLAFIGFAGSAAWWHETLLPESKLGIALWIATLVSALSLGVMAAFRHRSRIEGTSRAIRDQARRKVWSALAGVQQNLFHLCSVIPMREGRVQELIGATERLVNEYGEAARETHPLEAQAHMMLYSRLRRPFDYAEPFPLVPELQKALIESLRFSDENAGLYENLDSDEQRVLHRSLTSVVTMPPRQ